MNDDTLLPVLLLACEHSSDLAKVARVCKKWSAAMRDEMARVKHQRSLARTIAAALPERTTQRLNAEGATVFTMSLDRLGIRAPTGNRCGMVSTNATQTWATKGPGITFAATHSIWNYSTNTRIASPTLQA